MHFKAFVKQPEFRCVTLALIDALRLLLLFLTVKDRLLLNFWLGLWSAPTGMRLCHLVSVLSWTYAGVRNNGEERDIAWGSSTISSPLPHPSSSFAHSSSSSNRVWSVFMLGAQRLQASGSLGALWRTGRRRLWQTHLHLPKYRMISSSQPVIEDPRDLFRFNGILLDRKPDHKRKSLHVYDIARNGCMFAICSISTIVPWRSPFEAYLIRQYTCPFCIYRHKPFI